MNANTKMTTVKQELLNTLIFQLPHTKDAKDFNNGIITLNKLKCWNSQNITQQD